MVGGRRSGKESAVNVGDLKGKGAEFMTPGASEEPPPSGVRAAVVAQASLGKTDAGRSSGTEEGSRLTPGAAKGGRKANPPGAGPNEERLPQVARQWSGDKQGREDLWQSHKAERGVWSWGMLEALARGVKGGKWFSLIDKVGKKTTLAKSWEKVKANAGAPGVDGITIKRFEQQAPKRLEDLHEQISRGDFEAQPIQRVWIPKPGSTEKRPLGIPTVRDRVVQTAMRMVIEPIFEKRFAPQSYGFRPGRGCKDALRRVDQLLESGHLYVVDIDIKGYFDSIPHDRLLELVGQQIADGRVLGMIEKFLKAGVMEALKYWQPEEGTPQGGVISPLLANIYLNPLDWLMKEAGLEMVRYADDMVVLCRDEQTAARALEKVQHWCTQAGLSLHPEKTRVVKLIAPREHFDFLGYRFWCSRKGGIKRLVRPKSEKKLRESIKPRTRRCNGKSMEALVAELNPILRGWYGYFKHAHWATLGTIDGWIRGRLRAILRKRRRGKGRGRGDDHHRWPNAYFDRLGLFSLQGAHLAELFQSP